MRVFYWLWVLAFSSACTQSIENDHSVFHGLAPVIYGDDGRKDYYQVQNLQLIQLARATVALFESPQLVLNKAKGAYKIFDAVEPIKLCKEEKYAEQPQWAFCSGALVASDVILTAGHCIENLKECRNTKFVFDYHLKNIGDKLEAVPLDNTFSCLEIIYHTDELQGADFALIRLDRPVPDRQPLRFSHQAVTFQHSLLLVGYPQGMPLKFTFDGKARSLITETYFKATLDAFVGNSGSPVFNLETLEIVGVLSRGERDYERKNSCYISKQCNKEECRGEDVTRVSEVLKVWQQ